MISFFMGFDQGREICAFGQQGHNQEQSAAEQSQHCNAYDRSIWYDTSAQWVAAVTGAAVAVFTFVTVILVFKAIATDNAALGEAKEQTIEARKATVAAFRSAEIATAMGRAQTRAYISAAWAVAQDRGAYSKVIVNFINTGQTPALWINIWADYHVFDHRGYIPELGELYPREGIDFGPLEGGQNISLPPCRDNVSIEIQRVKDSASLTFQVFGRVQYETVFNEVYETEIAFHTTQISPEFAAEPITMMRTPNLSRTFRLLKQKTDGYTSA